MSENLRPNLYQVESLKSFKDSLTQHGLHLARGKCTTLQVNVGLLCNQSCKHCHLEAGPTRQEIMAEKTIADVLKLATRFRFETIDITGGAPEMNPHIETLISSLAPLTQILILRSNLTAIAAEKQKRLLELLTENRVMIVASLPSLNEVQLESQRGKNSFVTSINTLKKLNGLGYGLPDSNLELNLVNNPTGAFLPASQEQTEKRFRPGNLEKYILKLASNFNPCTLDGLMCRSLISVSWDGYLFDCDFNQSLQLYMGGKKKHISELLDLPGPVETIAVSEHCYTCTAGSGFT
ncbi:MAG: hypothetical protein AMJ61_16265 [Desulfobacterales bacterium SG8_35_2]|nr:MAG: hypothetical protein AMJ61_16265 [Desulfobacterales bacterium SG8_35_2]